LRPWRRRSLEGHRRTPYLNKESAAQELTNALRKVASGGKYLSPALSERLALDLALEGRKAPHEALSDHEYRIMWLLASGKPIGRIAREMSLSPSTVSTYRSRILRKLNLTSNAELVRELGCGADWALLRG
jgi:DNA-binding NarL/FixJ family response regulator